MEYETKGKVLEYDAWNQADTIENSTEACLEYHKAGWGSSQHFITREQLKEFLEGKLIAIMDGEYTHTIELID